MSPILKEQNNMLSVETIDWKYQKEPQDEKAENSL